MGEDAEKIDIKSTSTDVASTLELQDCRLSDAGKYSVTISNRVGAKKMSFKVKVIGAPGQVGPVTCKDVTSSSIVVNWSIPEHDGGEMVERYVVEKRGDRAAMGESDFRLREDDVQGVERDTAGKELRVPRDGRQQVRFGRGTND